MSLHSWPDYIMRALEYLKPPENMTVSQWAERYRVLPPTSSIPGRWRNAKTPYLVGVMDAFGDPEIEEIYMCSSAQIAKTEFLLNVLGYTVMQDPASVLMVLPDNELGADISKDRIRPFIMAVPELKERFDFNTSEIRQLRFDGMYVAIVGSNSPAALASRPIRIVLLDEVDKFPGATAKEADPISLARERTATFPDYKFCMTSTPTIKTGPIWKALEGADAERHYFMPCPHCGRYIEFKFAQLRWPGKEEGLSQQERAEQAAYVCQECGALIYDRDKPGMLLKGEWRDVARRAPVVKRVGFWISRLYSPFASFSEIALEYMRSYKDPEKLQNFTNSWLAEPWEDRKLSTSADIVMERQTELPEFTVPEWAHFLTAGVDVQETSYYWTIRAWGLHWTSQLVANGQAFGWNELERIMNTQYVKTDGTSAQVALCLVDSGYMPDATYDFCRNNIDWAKPCKGTSNPMKDHYKISSVNRSGTGRAGSLTGMPLVLVDGGKYKDMIASRMHRENGEGSWMVFGGCSEEYAAQVTSEHKVNVKIGRRTEARWQLKRSHADNHYLDCEVYAMAAADILGVSRLHLNVDDDDTDDQAVSIQQGNSWLGDMKGWW